MVHVITHAIGAGGEYEIQGYEDNSAAIPNLRVHRAARVVPWHIPDDKEQTLALLDLTISVIRKHGVQILDSGYLVPYGIVGHLAKESTGVRHLVRHGGSDLEKFFKEGILKGLLNQSVTNADAVITDKFHQDLLQPLASNLMCQPPYVPDGAVFAPSNASRPQWKLASIGKINYHWQHKRLESIADIMKHLSGQFECWVVGQGTGISAFQSSLSQEVKENFIWNPFVAPWEMPQLLGQFDAIFIFESGLPHAVFSNLALEVLCSGVGIITDRPDFTEMYKDLVTVDKDQVLVVSPSDPANAAKMIPRWIQDRAQVGWSSSQLVSFDEYLSGNEAVYDKVATQSAVSP